MRPGMTVMWIIVALIACAAESPAQDAGTASPPVIAVSSGASFSEKFAAKEVRRYLYLRMGTVARIVEHASAIPGSGPAVVVARKDRPLVKSAGDAKLAAEIAKLGPEAYRIRTVMKDARRIVVIAGGGDAGVLYGAYRFAERLGVRFSLHGDIIPDDRIPFGLPPDLDEHGSPLFETRGIQPFHDFPEGPDWWDADDYKAILSQLPRLGMNLFALHTYPEGGPNAEPAVWIGVPGDVNPDGTVRASYPSSWQNTLRGNWGYLSKKTGAYTRGASMLFDRDDYGAEVMRGHMPSPSTPDGMNEVFDRAGAMFRDAFSYARALGVKICVGTETPLTIPKMVRERLSAAGKNPADSATVAELYEGMFRRIAKTHPLDYFWFWTPEGWTWEGNSPDQVRATIADIGAARAALKASGAPFRLATCGWVLGPNGDRALFGRTLPGDVALSCINRQVGMTPVDRAFTQIANHPKWAIPWMEDDPALTSPQLWAGRMRQDAADALAYGCTGLLGIHWRTRVLSPNVRALARAAWDQSGWGSVQASGPMDGRAEKVEGPVKGTDDPDLYRTMRMDVTEYRFAVPDGEYTVTFRFCEPSVEKAGERVFAVAVQGREAIPRMDLFAEAGKLAAVDKTVSGVRVSDGVLRINFLQFRGAPCVSAIEIEGAGLTKRINCGGPSHGKYDADWTAIPARFRPVADFYDDWCASEFGPGAGPEASKVFARMDGYLPRPADWVNGPGGIRPDARSWDTVARDYAFVDEFAALSRLVKGKGARERYDYWLETFRYQRAMGRLNCLWGEFEAALAKAKAEPDSLKRAEIAMRDALPRFSAMVGGVDEIYDHILRTVSTNGELGTVMNWEQHIFPLVFDAPLKELEKAAGAPVAADVAGRPYSGPPRLIVPTVRPSIAKGEPFNVRAIVLDSRPPKSVEFLMRPLGARGEEKFTSIPLVSSGRGVYRAAVRFLADMDDFEYRIRAVTADGAELLFPPTAPETNQTVVVTDN